MTSALVVPLSAVAAAETSTDVAVASAVPQWERVYRNDFTSLTDVTAFQSTAEVNSRIRPDDTTNSALQKPVVRSNVVVTPDAAAHDGSALVSHTREATYALPTGTATGWANGRWMLKRHEPPPVRVRTRVKLTAAAYAKAAVMWWPSGGGWPWEVDFVESFGGQSLTDYWGGRQRVAQRWHADLDGDGLAKEQLMKDVPLDATRYHVYDLFITPTRMWIEIDGVEAYATTDERFIPKDSGFLSIGKALTGRRDTVGRTNDAVFVDWVEIYRPSTVVQEPLGEPVDVVAAADDSADAATLRWAPPASDGGSAVTGYVVSRDGTDAAGAGPATVTLPATARRHLFPGLRPGSSYTLSVRAVTSAATGPAVGRSVVLQPDVPGTPTSVSAVGLDAQGAAEVAWAPPATDGGSPVTGYRVHAARADAPDLPTATAALGSDATSHLLTGLQPGTAYVVSVAAVNAVGTGARATVAVELETTTPGAPAGASVTQDAAARTATLTWSPPPSDGGQPVTGYRVARDGVDANGTGAWSTTVAATAGSHTFRNLRPGDTYRLTVEALNVHGAGAAGSASVRMAAPPAAPAVTAATAGDRTAQLEWTAPASDGGSPVSGYLVRRWVGTTLEATTPVAASSTTLAVTGLANGTAYVFDVLAVNAAGAGAPSTPSSPVVPSTVPDAPVELRATSGAAGGPITASVAWAPAGDGGAPILSYQVRALRMSSTGTVLERTYLTVPGTVRSVVMGLPRTGSYRFVVVARNATGASPLSARSNLVSGR